MIELRFTNIDKIIHGMNYPEIRERHQHITDSIDLLNWKSQIFVKYFYEMILQKSGAGSKTHNKTKRVNRRKLKTHIKTRVRRDF